MQILKCIVNALYMPVAHILQTPWTQCVGAKSNIIGLWRRY